MLKRLDTSPPRDKSGVLRNLGAGVGIGIIVELLAIVLAVISGGAGHGDYVLARLLFPVPFLLMPIEHATGFMTLSAIALQFPLYGGLIGWAIHRRSRVPVIALGLLHLVAVIACFSGALSEFI